MPQYAELRKVDLVAVEDLPVLSGGLVYLLDLGQALLVKGLLDMLWLALFLPDDLPLDAVGQVESP